MARVLVIEDDAGIRANILDLLEAEGYEAVGAEDGRAGIAKALADPPALVVCDIAMPFASGYEVLRALRQHDATRPVPFVFLTAKADRDDVRLGMNLGADDYITKPFTRVELLDAVRARLERASARGASPAQRIASAPAEEAPVIVLDERMRSIYDVARRAAAGPISILVLGETGVGKDVLAREIHRASPRASGPFVALNCAALSETLLESEIGDIPMTTQVKLLRVLEERKVRRVGARAPIPIDVRFVSATHKDIEEDAARGAFRADLLFRLNGLTLHVPPLRERSAEILPLAEAMLAATSRALGRATPRLADEVVEALFEHEWPGNVRELRHAMERAALLASGERVTLEHLPAKIAASLGETGASRELRAEVGDLPRARDAVVAEVERRRIEDALARSGGNQTHAAALLGISRRTLVSRLSEYEFPRPRKRS